MPGKHRLVLTLSVAALLCGACDNRFRRLNAPPQGESERPSQLQPFFANMVDNATLSDMCLADPHFVPHTSELNGTGTARLDRMSSLLGTYGGTVRYETDATDSSLVDQRLAHVREYLATTGVDMGRIQVAAKRSGGRGLAAVDAIRAKNEGTVDDAAQSKSSGPGGGGAGGAAAGGGAPIP